MNNKIFIYLFYYITVIMKPKFIILMAIALLITGIFLPLAIDSLDNTITAKYSKNYSSSAIAFNPTGAVQNYSDIVIAQSNNYTTISVNIVKNNTTVLNQTLKLKLTTNATTSLNGSLNATFNSITYNFALDNLTSIDVSNFTGTKALVIQFRLNNTSDINVAFYAVYEEIYTDDNTETVNSIYSVIAIIAVIAIVLMFMSKSEFVE